MKKIILLVFVFLISSAFILLSDIPILSIPERIGIIVIEAIIFQVLLMDKSFFKKEKRAELRKFIDD